MGSGSEYGTGHDIDRVLSSAMLITESSLSENFCIVASVNLAKSDDKPSPAEPANKFK